MLWCESEFTVKLVSDREKTRCGFSQRCFLQSLQHGFPVACSGSCGSRGWALKGLIQKASPTFGSLTAVSSCWACSEPPTVFYDYNPQGVFFHHWSQFTNGFPLLDLLKLSDSPSKILVTTVCLFLLVVLRKCIVFIVLQYGKFDASKTKRLQPNLGKMGLILSQCCTSHLNKWLKFMM